MITKILVTAFALAVVSQSVAAQTAQEYVFRSPVNSYFLKFSMMENVFEVLKCTDVGCQALGDDQAITYLEYDQYKANLVSKGSAPSDFATGGALLGLACAVVSRGKVCPVNGTSIFISILGGAAAGYAVGSLQGDFTDMDAADVEFLSEMESGLLRARDNGKNEVEVLFNLDSLVVAISRVKLAN